MKKNFPDYLREFLREEKKNANLDGTTALGCDYLLASLVRRTNEIPIDVRVCGVNARYFWGQTLRELAKEKEFTNFVLIN